MGIPKKVKEYYKKKRKHLVVIEKKDVIKEIDKSNLEMMSKWK